MISFFNHTRHFYLTSLLLVFAAGVLHWHSVMGTDNSWLLYVADQVLKGKRLYIDISETNPPMIVWLNLFPAWLAQISGLSLPQAFSVFISLLTLLSLVLCWQVNRAYPLLNWLYLAAITLVLTICFGQREQLFLLFAMPYLLGWLPKNKPTAAYAAFAAVGCVIKPYFILIIASAAIIRAVHQRSIRSWFAVSQWLFAFLFAGYFLYLLCGDTTYWETTGKLLMELYHGYDTQPESIYRKLFILAWPLIPCGLWFAVKDRPRENQEVLHWLIALQLAALLVFYWQFKGWTNHEYPSNIFGFMACGWLILALYPYRQQFVAKLAWCVSITLCVYYLVTGLHFLGRIVWPDETNVTSQKIAFFKPYAGESVFALSYDATAAFPAVLHADLRYKSPYVHVWFLPGFVADGIQMRDERELALRHRVVEAFTEAKPDWVIVPKTKELFHSSYGNYTSDLIQYYRVDERFETEWKNYRLITEIKDELIYQRAGD